MCNRKTIGVVLTVGGAVLLIGSLLTDTLGLASKAGVVSQAGFGLYQAIGAGAGAIAAIVGIVLSRGKKVAV